MVANKPNGDFILARLAESNVPDKEIDELLDKAKSLNLSAEDFEKVSRAASAKKGNKDIRYHNVPKDSAKNSGSLSSFIEQKIDSIRIKKAFNKNQLNEYIDNNPQKTGAVARFLENYAKSQAKLDDNFFKSMDYVLNKDDKLADWGVSMFEISNKKDITRGKSFKFLGNLAKKHPSIREQAVDKITHAKFNPQSIETLSSVVGDIASTDTQYTQWGFDMIKNIMNTTLKSGVVYDDSFCGLTHMVDKRPELAQEAMNILTDEKYAKAKQGNIPQYYYYDRSIRSCVNANSDFATQKLHNLVLSREIPEGGNYSLGWMASIGTIEKANPNIKNPIYNQSNRNTINAKESIVR